MTMITPSYLGETIEYSSLHACRSTLEDPTEEAAEIASLEVGDRSRALLLRFSMKEAVYKALDPYVRRYVAFREVTVAPRSDGTADVQTSLARGEGPFRVEAAWLRVDGWIVTTAKVGLGE